jgi:hypothetical protein
MNIIKDLLCLLINTLFFNFQLKIKKMENKFGKGTLNLIVVVEEIFNENKTYFWIRFKWNSRYCMQKKEEDGLIWAGVPNIQTEHLPWAGQTTF